MSPGRRRCGAPPSHTTARGPNPPSRGRDRPPRARRRAWSPPTTLFPARAAPSRCSTRGRTGSPKRSRERRPGAAAATSAAGASLLLLVQRQLVGDAVGELLEQLVELRAREVRDLELDVLDLRARGDAPALDLAEKVERR